MMKKYRHESEMMEDNVFEDILFDDVFEDRMRSEADQGVWTSGNSDDFDGFAS